MKKPKKYTVIYRNDPNRPFGGLTFAANPAYKHIKTNNLKKYINEEFGGEFWFVFSGWGRMVKKY